MKNHGRSTMVFSLHFFANFRSCGIIILEWSDDMSSQIRVSCAVPDVRPGDVKNNVAQICKWISTAAEGRCDAVAFPELAVTGSTCMDLFFQKCLLSGAQQALQTILSHCAQYPKLTVIVGMPLQLDQHISNCAVVISNGVVAGIGLKKTLSTVERRWFSKPEIRSVNARRLGIDGDYDIGVSDQLEFSVADVPATVDILGDTFSAEREYRAQIVFAMAASPELAGSSLHRKSELCKRFAGTIAYVSAGSGESNQDCIFSGHSLVVSNGAVVAEGESAPATDYLLIADVRPGDQCRWMADNVAANEISAEPFLPEIEREAYVLSAFRIQAAALAKRLGDIHVRPVIGVSGGLDSTLALLVAVEAAHMLGKSADYVVGVTMPCFGTTQRTKDNAWKLMELLGVTPVQIDIHAAVQQHYKDIGHSDADYDTTYENAQARERTQVLMDYAGKIGGIVIGTGDLSELALGWCTYNGDHMSMYSVNSSVPKTVIPHIIREVAALPGYSCAERVLMDVIDTPISPELLPPDKDGKIAQQTEDVVGPYALHDFYLYCMLKHGWEPSEIYHSACKVFSGQYDNETIKKWLFVFYKRFFSQQFKRSCLPEGVQVFGISLSPRGGLSMPSDASANLWLEQVNNL